MNTGIVTGNFDGLHRGHVSLFEKLKEECVLRNIQPKVLSFSPHTRHFLKDETFPLLTPLSEKKYLLQKLFGLELLEIPFDDTLRNLGGVEYISFLRESYQAKLWIMGFDHRFGKHAKVYGTEREDLCSRFGLESYIMPPLEEEAKKVSSSRIRELIELGEIEKANALLGYSYLLQGEVVAGNQLGRTIGFPTANLSVDPSQKLVPQFGVYACEVEIDGSRFSGALNIGKNPTFDQKELRVEVHILGFSGDLYGKPLSLWLKKRIRSERKFASEQELKEQICSDVAQIESILS